MGYPSHCCGRMHSKSTVSSVLKGLLAAECGGAGEAVRGRLQRRDILEPPRIAQAGNHIAVGKMYLPVILTRGRPAAMGQPADPCALTIVGQIRRSHQPFFGPVRSTTVLLSNRFYEKNDSASML
jgi:hypothetical protein